MNFKSDYQMFPFNLQERFAVLTLYAVGVVCCERLSLGQIENID